MHSDNLGISEEAYCFLDPNDEKPTSPPETDYPSPFFEQIDTDLHDVTFHGAVHDNSSIFRQPPSAIVDEAWNRVAATGFEITRTSAEALSLTGKDPSTCVKAPADWQLGSDAYLVQIDVFHQIHCLNELRKELYSDHYYNEDYRAQVPWSVHIAHKQHCVHILLQNLMCHADLEVIPHHWIHYSTINQLGRPETEPLADFSVHKKCRNFDAILAWAEGVSVKDLAAKWPKLRAPAGSKVFDGKEGYF
ncbi:hypothetical protein KCU92_g2900, partial [Aureobasidium melanogenum]